MRRRTGSILITALLAAGMLAVPAGAASASTACNATAITINATAGGEAKSSASGHAHVTGKHYVKSITSSKLWTWWADNDNGSTDKADTYYGIIQC